ncbi:transglutaminase [Azorhizobium oxalatiphilum]|uniref:Transglutaminase n=1 Tax=Azorhizobium oxalatiphilum TaxID=980631 RepID=A0A917C9E1_9HYPH|nr:transglutaminase family protein [Azorhizobium oxalatiphilum]GGF77989.1 transglutaminase [Azorhizobium oxalatiphilum]
MRVHIVHRTTYDYHQPVALGPHRLLLRPRAQSQAQLLDFSLTVSPEANLFWEADANGNALALATFREETDRLVVESRAELELPGIPGPAPLLAPEAATYPFLYSEADWSHIAPLAAPACPDAEGRLTAWARGLVAGQPTPSLALLQDLNAAVRDAARYEERIEPGVQPPLETLQRGIASCRDFALLFAEGARALGLAARLVSGYLANPGGSAPGTATTHAWAEVFLPGAGFVPFDSTHATMGGHNLVPVAVGRTLEETTPVSGSFLGRPDALRQMIVDVEITA